MTHHRRLLTFRVKGPLLARLTELKCCLSDLAVLDITEIIRILPGQEISDLQKTAPEQSFGRFYCSKQQHITTSVPSIASMASAIPSPALRVFVVPEVLEHILICLAEAEIEHQECQPHPEALQPLKCLAAVQRVHSTFHDTIKSSKRIQRLMYEPLESKMENTSKPLSLLGGALLLTTLGPECTSAITDGFILEIKQTDTTAAKALKTLKKFQSKKKNIAQASWGKVKILKDSAALLTMRIPPNMKHEDEYFNQETDWGLGEDFDLFMLVHFYCGIMEHVYEEDRLAKRCGRITTNPSNSGSGRKGLGMTEDEFKDLWSKRLDGMV